ncbi:AAA family ATPase [Acinetobacter sp.]|uniref:AAA family ATPase n=1 Tax=Acinetobacter sp. TaxID=472 RepID=UPI00375220EF
MKCINLHGGPCSGKSTCAAHMFSHLKRHNVKTELVGEFAKELIYLGNETQLVNQVYIMGCQYRKMKDLQRHNIDIAISDSPLLLQLTYCRNKPYYNEMSALVHKLNDEFDNINVFINRVKPYQTYGRVNTEYEAKDLDKVIWDSMEGNFDYVINGDTDGIDTLADEMLQIADKQLLAKY